MLALPLTSRRSRSATGPPDDPDDDLDAADLGRHRAAARGVRRRRSPRPTCAYDLARARLRQGRGPAERRWSYRRLSLWWDTLPGPLVGDLRPRARQATSTPTSRSSAPATPGCGPPTTSPRPTRRCASWCVEEETAGFGASGRNGGWCSALFPASWGKIARGRPAARQPSRMQRAMFDTVDEVGRVVAAEGIDVHWAKGGTHRPRPHAGAARPRPGRGRRRTRVGLRRRGLRAGSTPTRCASGSARPTCSAAPTPRTAPRSTRRGWSAALAQTVERAGRTHLRGHAGAVDRAGRRSARRTASVRAEQVIRATEGYTPSLPGLPPRPSRRSTR